MSYHDGEILPISVALRFETVIRLPDSEVVLQPTGGDKDHWTVAWAANFVFIKAGLPGSRTNFNVLCKSGHLYSFSATEVTPGGRPDLLVIVSLVEAAGAVQHPKFVLAAELESCQSHSKELEARFSDSTAGASKGEAAGGHTSHTRRCGGGPFIRKRLQVQTGSGEATQNHGDQAR